MFFGDISHPGVAADGLLALLAGVGVQALVTFHTVGVLLSQHILLPKQGLLAVMAVVALSHFDPGSLNLGERGKKKVTTESERKVCGLMEIGGNGRWERLFHI